MGEVGRTLAGGKQDVDGRFTVFVVLAEDEVGELWNEELEVVADDGVIGNHWNFGQHVWHFFVGKQLEQELRSSFVRLAPLEALFEGEPARLRLGPSSFVTHLQDKLAFGH